MSTPQSFYLPVQINGFTPINVDSLGQVIASQTEQASEAEPPSKRRKRQTPNPWTPRKPRTRPRNTVKKGHSDTTTKDERQTVAVNVPANQNVDRTELPGAISATTSAKLHSFAYRPETTTTFPEDDRANLQANKALEEHLSRRSSLTPEPATPLKDYRTRFKSFVPAAAPLDMEADRSEIQVPATQSLVVPQTPPTHYTDSEYVVGPGLSFPVEGWDDAVDMGWEGNVADELDDGAEEPSTPMLFGEKQVDESYRDIDIVRPDIAENLETGADDVASDETFPELCEPFREEIGEHDDLADIEDVLMSAEAGLSSKKTQQMKTPDEFLFSPRPDPLCTPCPSEQSDEAPRVLKDEEDFFGELDDHDIFDMVDVAAQVSAALEQPSPADTANPHSVPKLRYNPPKQYKKVPSNPSKLPRTHPAPTFQSPMKKPESKEPRKATKLEDSLDMPRNHFKAPAPTQSRPQVTMLPSSTSLLPSDPNAPAPFLRGGFPKLLKDNSPIEGISSNLSLKVCFRVGEMLKAVRNAKSDNRDIILELYAKVVHREEQPGDLHLTFGDLFYPDKPPYLAAIWRRYRVNSYWITDAEALNPGTICRALGTVERESMTGKWVMSVLSAQAVSWEDVEMTKGIVCAQ